MCACSSSLSISGSITIFVLQAIWSLDCQGGLQNPVLSPSCLPFFKFQIITILTNLPLHFYLLPRPLALFPLLSLNRNTIKTSSHHIQNGKITDRNLICDSRRHPSMESKLLVDMSNYSIYQVVYESVFDGV